MSPQRARRLRIGDYVYYAGSKLKVVGFPHFTKHGIGRFSDCFVTVEDEPGHFDNLQISNVIAPEVWERQNKNVKTS